MSISEESNTKQLVVKYDNSTSDTVYIDDVNINNVKLHIYVSTILNFYQWNDFGESNVLKQSF
jgi:hypothetical protein